MSDGKLVVNAQCLDGFRVLGLQVYYYFQESDSLTAVFTLECDDSGRLFGDSPDGETPQWGVK